MKINSLVIEKIKDLMKFIEIVCWKFKKSACSNRKWLKPFSLGRFLSNPRMNSWAMVNVMQDQSVETVWILNVILNLSCEKLTYKM